MSCSCFRSPVPSRTGVNPFHRLWFPFVILTLPFPRLLRNDLIHDPRALDSDTLHHRHSALCCHYNYQCLLVRLHSFGHGFSLPPLFPHPRLDLPVRAFIQPRQPPLSACSGILCIFAPLARDLTRPLPIEQSRSAGDWIQRVPQFRTLNLYLDCSSSRPDSSKRWSASIPLPRHICILALTIRHVYATSTARAFIQHQRARRSIARLKDSSAQTGTDSKVSRTSLHLFDYSFIPSCWMINLPRGRA